jgi:hypothetical protein
VQPSTPWRSWCYFLNWTPIYSGEFPITQSLIGESLDIAKYGAVRAELRKRFKSDLSPKELDAAIKAERSKLRLPDMKETGDAGDWKDRLIRSDAGNIKPLLANAITAVQCAEWQPMFDEFAGSDDRKGDSMGHGNADMGGHRRYPRR